MMARRWTSGAVDFSVRNGSGRWLDHLIARYQIDSEWPDCTNWDGPGVRPVPTPAEWADSIGFIQESGRNVVAPDQTLTQTKFFIVLERRPGAAVLELVHGF